MAYDLVNGLNLVNNATANANTPTAPGVTGLFALTGRVVGNQVQLFATSYGLNELSQSYLYTITDDLGATSIAQVASESFTVLYTDPTGQTAIRGIAFGPGLPQNISFGTPPVLGAGGTGIVVASGGGSGNPVTYASLTPVVCAVSGAIVTGITAGTCTVAANQAGNASFGPALQATESFAIGGTAQVISFGGAPSVAVGGTAALGASASSGLAVVYSSLTPTTCSVSDGGVTGLSIGPCTIAVDQAGSAQYAAAARVTQTVSVSGATQNLSFGSTPNLSVQGTATLAATASSGLAVAFASSTPGTCAVAGNVVTGIAIGTCTVTADQAGNTQFAPAAEATLSFPVAGLGQTIAFGSAPAVNAGSTAAIDVSASSGLAVVLSSLTPNVCMIAGDTVTALAVGTCTIAADQAGNATYAAAPQATQSFPVAAMTAGGGTDPDGDVPLPGWAYPLLGLALAGLTAGRRRPGSAAA
jgi:hypothetical protein